MILARLASFAFRFVRTGSEGRVVVALMVFFLGAEGVVRVVETKLSKDVAHLRSLPEAARRLNAGGGAFTVLVVGNSLARCGVDREILAGGLERRLNRPVRVEFFVPDASSASEWAWGLKRYFGGKGPDLILVVTGRLHLFDQAPEPEKLGAYYLRSSQLADAIRSEPDGERRVRLLLGHFSILLANRERVRSLIGYHFLPGYAEVWSRIAAAPAAKPEAGSQGPDTPIGTGTQALRGLASHAQRSGSRLVVVTMALPTPYELPAQLRDELDHLGIAWLDLAKEFTLPPERFPDGYHLDEEGSRIFTAKLGSAIPGCERNHQSGH